MNASSAEDGSRAAKMSATHNAGGVYTDFGGLATLRAGAKSHAPETLDAVARQFEALFLQMMLKSMRATTGGDPLLGNGGELYTDLLDQQIALEFGRGKGLGIAELLAGQLTGKTVPAASVQALASAPSPAALMPPPQWFRAAPPPGATLRPATESIPSTPQQFVQKVWPHAERAARDLGVDPRLLVAQAALETGWGQAVPGAGRGRPSHNLFGIKADSRWSGSRVEVSTLEHVDGVLVRTRAPFRAYGSIAESFADYVDFVRGQPRYAAAVQAAGDSEAYIRALQAAGYATDPAYAEKILRLMDQSTLKIPLAAAEVSESQESDFDGNG